MFLIFDKSQINSYFISIGTVVILFFMTFFINKSPDSIQTCANEQVYINIIEQENIKL